MEWRQIRSHLLSLTHTIMCNRIMYSEKNNNNITVHTYTLMCDTPERRSLYDSYILFYTDILIFKCYNCSNFQIWLHWCHLYSVYRFFFLTYIGIVSVTDGRRRGFEANDQWSKCTRDVTKTHAIIIFTLKRTSFTITYQNRLGEQYNNMWIIASWVIYNIYS